MDWFKSLVRFFLILTIVVAVVNFSGCGSVGSDDIGVDNSFNPLGGGATATLRGRVAIPEAVAGSVRQSVMGSLVSVLGTKVYLEDNINIYGIADANGDYVIANVPLGSHKLIAKVTPVIGEVYLYRSGEVTVNQTSSTEPIPVSEVLYPQKAENYVTVNLVDTSTNQPLAFAEVTVWGEKKTTDENGKVVLGPLPDCPDEPVTISKPGYGKIESKFDFNSENNSEATVKMVSNTSENKNNAPVASILCENFEYNNGIPWLKKSSTVKFRAKVYDPDGDDYKLNWTASVGSISSDLGGSAVYSTPNEECAVLITLAATDSKGGVGESLLKINIGTWLQTTPATGTIPIATGTVPIATGTTPIATDTPQIATDTPSIPPSNQALSFVYPKDNQTINSDYENNIKVNLQWNCSKNAMVYFVYAGKNASSPSYLGSVNGDQDKVYSFTAKEPGDYYWKVVMFDNSQASYTSPIWHFNINSIANKAPNQPKLGKPDNDAVGVELSPTFSWSGSDPDGDALSYTLHFSNDINTLENGVVLANSAKTEFKINKILEPGKQYFWKVVARDNKGLSTSSGVYAFVTRKALSAPVLVSPKHASVDVSAQPTFSWTITDSESVFSFAQVYLTKTSAFTTNDIIASLTANTFVCPKPLEAGATYFWKVVAIDRDGLEISSQISSFTVYKNRAPNQPTLSEPRNGSRDVELLPTFRWSGSDPDGDGLTYRLYLSDSSVINENNLLIASTTATTYKPNRALEAGKQYFWKVVAEDKEGLETSSQVYSFTTAEATVSDKEAPVLQGANISNNEVIEEAYKKIRLDFNEQFTYDNSGAFVFEPTISGTWTKEDPASVIFNPSESWVSGAKYALTINRNKISDASGNTASGTYVIHFSIKPDVMVPSGYEVVAFPVDMKSGDDRTFTVTGLPANKEVYAVVVNTAQGSTTISKSLIESGDTIDPHLKFRYDEKKYPKPPVVSSKNKPNRSLNPNYIKDERSFWVQGANDVDNLVNVTMLTYSDHFIFYKDDELGTIPELTYNRLKEAAEVMYSKLVAAFGSFPEQGLDGESRISIVITNQLEPGTGGYFWCRDFYEQNFSEWASHSNECLAVYMRFYDSVDSMTATLAHELQHMINYNNETKNKTDAATWLNEGLSCYAEDVVGCGLATGNTNYYKRLTLSQESLADYTLTVFDDPGGNGIYGLAYLMVRYLSDPGRYATSREAAIQKLAGNTKNTIPLIEELTGEDFATTLGKWGMALFINDYQSTPKNCYGINQFDLAGNVGVKLTGYKYIALSKSGITADLRKNTVRGFYTTADSSGKATVRIRATAGVKVFIYYKK